MFVWPDEVNFGAVENFNVCPKIGGWGNNLKKKITIDWYFIFKV